MSRRYECADGGTLARRMMDRRDTARRRMPRLVQVAHDGEAALARCRDVSDIGMQLDLATPLTINDFVTIAFSPDTMFQGIVVWAKGRECGVAFTTPVDSAVLLAGGAPRSGNLPAMLALLGTRQRPAARHAALEGGRAAADHGFHPGLAVTLMTAPGCEERATVTWAKDNIAALVLEPQLQSGARQ